MAPVHREGFTRLSGRDCGDDQHNFHVIFIHGLLGHPQKTWQTAAKASLDNAGEKPRKSHGVRSWFKKKKEQTQSGNAQTSQDSEPSRPTYWPQQFLAPDIPQACVWTYGYNADLIGFFQGNNKNSISQHGRDLAVRLEREIEDEKPIVFVAHSLGGIVLKDAIHRSTGCRSRTRLIVFLGTPHRGSASAGWGQIVSNFARLALQDSNKQLLKTLEVNSEVLDNIHEEFKTIVFQDRISIHTFQEARGITGMKGLDSKVVDDFSSKMDLPKTLETVETIDANHMQMARYSGKDEHGYRAILGVIKAFAREETQRPSGVALKPSGPDSPKRHFMVPFAQDESFVGREAALERIGAIRRAHRLRHTRAALVGLGGVGKSQIAIEYAYQTKDSDLDMHVFWMHANNTTRVEQAYRNIADQAQLPGREDPRTDILQLVYAWLSSTEAGRWLMIVDNADDEEVFFSTKTETASAAQLSGGSLKGQPLASFLPQTSNGYILFTSRNAVAAANLTGTHGTLVSVEPMGEQEALALLQTRIEVQEQDEPHALALLKALACIPLAIMHAAAYIRKLAHWVTIEDYLKLFSESEDNSIHLLRNADRKDIRKDSTAQYAVLKTWQISFEKIAERHPAAVDMMACMSMLDYQGIPTFILQHSRSNIQFLDALAPLSSFSLVRKHGPEALTMHRLVQLSMRDWLQQTKKLDFYAREAIKLVAELLPSGRSGTWRTCEILLPHSREVINHSCNALESRRQQVDILQRIGMYYFHRGEYALASAKCRSALIATETLRGKDHSDTLKSISQLASVLENQGNYSEAEQMHRHTLAVKKRTAQPGDLKVAVDASKLGLVLIEQGRFSEAEILIRESLVVKREKCGDGDWRTSIDLHNLGRCMLEQKNFMEAIDLFKQAVKSDERLYAGQVKQVIEKGVAGAVDKHFIHTAFDQSGKDDEHTANHPYSFSTLSKLGVALSKLEKYDEAEFMLSYALKGLEGQLGTDHADTLTGVSQLGSVLSDQGKYKEAESMHRRALEGREKALGRDHPDTLTSIYNLAYLFHQQHNYKIALAYYERAYVGFEVRLGGLHPTSVACGKHRDLALQEMRSGHSSDS